MTAWLVAIITVILIALILAHRLWPVFRKRSEFPKYRFLNNLGITNGSNANEAHTEPVPLPASNNNPNHNQGEDREPHQS